MILAPTRNQTAYLAPSVELHVCNERPKNQAASAAAKMIGFEARLNTFCGSVAFHRRIADPCACL